ncbi:hypothetical protein BN7_178 [Wickerhamomyces ciferrii]|uniref:BOD1/SHG1 domain-containing protein n=1 Tax=Wickerhamomyces ciferrii (strain ATCC 14091 / BCRC 22168 / CBS 111 / JCM 3599 / NBRC 0793 / NRRL Y-1031 F-60-10) TaxID=1206466 RepID=K0KGX0_WICCF|nr:uncharacterized protein BN7_178 [Wickerhamomyces ciferrii]CCH40644.1 hypothetical protein BN7_178 [Wickerhamomyces ciferrii]
MSTNDAKSLSISYKRKGYFDEKRSAILEHFKTTEAHDELLATIKAIVDRIVRKNPELLLKNKGQLAALIEGTISRQVQNGSISNNAGVIPSANDKDLDLGDVKNVYDIFDEEVKQSTIGSDELKEEIRNVLKELKEA